MANGQCWREKTLGDFVLERDPASVPAARERALKIIGEDCSVRDDVLLVVSELVTNAIRHPELTGQVHVTLTTGMGLLIVEVRDPGTWYEAPRVVPPYDPLAVGGRGLLLVALLCGGRWGTYVIGGGERIVWAAVPVTAWAPRAQEVIAARRRLVA
ncbi:ATP-binding protein [Streptosporangium jomthongense]|uniref:ATP-binding protein n=1 Tax=Streptosporangium jomthongense TaxID=1193683 RepID=A0ABV8EWN1_9ACTN